MVGATSNDGFASWTESTNADVHRVLKNDTDLARMMLDLPRSVLILFDRNVIVPKAIKSVDVGL